MSLLETPSIGSLFKSWSGACSGSTGCLVTMDGTKAVTATFISPLPVKIDDTFYESIQDAFDNAHDKDLIMLKEGILPGALTASAYKTVTIRGGYHPSYNESGGDSIIQNVIKLRRGRINFDNVKVR